MPCLGDDGHACVEAHARFALDVVLVGKTRVESAVWDDHAVGGDGVAVCVLGRVCGGEGVVAHSVGLVEHGIAQPDLVFGALCLGFEQRDGLGGFGEDVLAVRVDQGHHGTADIEAEGSELRKGSQALVARRFRAVACLGEALFSYADNAVDETLRVEPWPVVSADRSPSLAFTVTARQPASSQARH